MHPLLRPYTHCPYPRLPSNSVLPKPHPFCVCMPPVHPYLFRKPLSNYNPCRNSISFRLHFKLSMPPLRFPLPKPYSNMPSEPLFLHGIMNVPSYPNPKYCSLHLSLYDNPSPLYSSRFYLVSLFHNSPINLSPILRFYPSNCYCGIHPNSVLCHLSPRKSLLLSVKPNCRLFFSILVCRRNNPNSNPFSHLTSLPSFCCKVPIHCVIYPKFFVLNSKLRRISPDRLRSKFHLPYPESFLSCTRPYPHNCLHLGFKSTIHLILRFYLFLFNLLLHKCCPKSKLKIIKSIY